VIDEFFSSSGQILKFCCPVIGCLGSEGFLLTIKELGDGEGILFVSLCFA
jgi:hypothetical protein